MEAAPIRKNFLNKVWLDFASNKRFFRNFAPQKNIPFFVSISLIFISYMQLNNSLQDIYK